MLLLYCLLETKPIRMDTKDGIAGTKTYRKLATVRVFH
jgi:hypothetical protein